MTYLSTNSIHETFSTLDGRGGGKLGSCNSNLDLVCAQGLLEFFNDSLGSLLHALRVSTLDKNTGQDCV